MNSDYEITKPDHRVELNEEKKRFEVLKRKVLQSTEIYLCTKTNCQNKKECAEEVFYESFNKILTRKSNQPINHLLAYHKLTAIRCAKEFFGSCLICDQSFLSFDNEEISESLDAEASKSLPQTERVLENALLWEEFYKTLNEEDKVWFEFLRREVDDVIIKKWLNTSGGELSDQAYRQRKYRKSVQILKDFKQFSLKGKVR